MKLLAAIVKYTLSTALLRTLPISRQENVLPQPVDVSPIVEAIHRDGAQTRLRLLKLEVSLTGKTEFPPRSWRNFLSAVMSQLIAGLLTAAIIGTVVYAVAIDRADPRFLELAVQGWTVVIILLVTFGTLLLVVKILFSVLSVTETPTRRSLAALLSVTVALWALSIWQAPRLIPFVSRVVRVLITGQP
ncbi:hypothetical protein [Auraticoccus monumenti]|uniref:hypothetical protein n=1 Tax=Auraticoccus monumenti TaxID=675864 RepID=UPI0012FCAAEE|nr:hypothetical protein [Auraticoccus monumenti]